MKAYYPTIDLAYYEHTINGVPFPSKLWVTIDLELAKQESKSLSLSPPTFMVNDALKEGFKGLKPFILILEIEEESIERMRLKDKSIVPYSIDLFEENKEEISFLEISLDNVLENVIGFK